MNAEDVPKVVEIEGGGPLPRYGITRVEYKTIRR